MQNPPPDPNPNNSEDPGHLHPPSATQEELDIDRPTDLSPLGPHQAWMDVAASHRAFTAGAQSNPTTDAECWTQNEPNLIQQAPTNMQRQIQPHMSPFLFNHRALPPGVWVQPQFIMVPCCMFPPVAPAPDPRFGFITSALVPFSPIPPPYFPLVEVEPRWRQCLPAVHDHQPRQTSP